MRLILYSKQGCHLCEGLQEKLEKIVQMETFPSLQLEVRDITSCEDWFKIYQYEVPVLFLVNRQDEDSCLGGESDLSKLSVAKEQEQPIPRPSPRASLQQLEQMLRKYVSVVSDSG